MFSAERLPRLTLGTAGRRRTGAARALPSGSRTGPTRGRPSADVYGASPSAHVAARRSRSFGLDDTYYYPTSSPQARRGNAGTQESEEADSDQYQTKRRSHRGRR
jgi:hypothetical protein